MSNDFIKWTVYAPEDGDYQLAFRYALASNSRPLRLTINGVVKIPSIDFPITGSWSNWSDYTTIQSLDEGNNTITLTAIGSSGGNFDELVINKAATGLTPPNSKKQAVSIFPNPYISGKLKIQLSGFENQSDIVLKIRTVTGQLVHEQVINSLNEVVSLPHLAKKAIYILSVETDDKIAVSKLIVS
jgi:hypothetical protein